MSAIASFPHLELGKTATKTGPRPVVFINDHPEPRLRVRQVIHTGPLATTEIELDFADRPHERLHPLGQTAIIGIPRTLIGGETRWQVLAVGQLAEVTQREGATRHDRRFTLLDRWSEALDASPDIFATAETTLPLNTVGEAIENLSTRFGLELSLYTLPSSLRDAPLTAPVAFDRPARTTLESLLEEHGLFIQRRLTLTRSSVAEQRSVRPLEFGRRIALPPTCTVKLDTTAPAQVARPWIARATRPSVESTFELSPGWDSSLEGQPDADYDRSQSSDFSRFANVYRLWRLNEDATLDGEPFDLATLFGQPALPPTPIAFGDCLTLDDAGRPLPPIVEVSLNAGGTWSRYTSPAQILSDRAGVYLDPTALAAATLTAAKNADLRLRVTATLTSPDATELQRWQGNPFAELGAPVRLDASSLFQFKRVDPQSIHHAGVRAGSLLADEHDDAPAMLAWLLQQLDRENQLPLRRQATATLTLANARPELRVGDRIDHAFLSNHDEPNMRFASVTRVACDFTDRLSTSLQLRV